MFKLALKQILDSSNCYTDEFEEFDEHCKEKKNLELATELLDNAMKT